MLKLILHKKSDILIKKTDILSYKNVFCDIINILCKNQYYIMKKLNAIVITCGMKMGFSNFDLVGKMYLILTFIIMRGENI